MEYLHVALTVWVGVNAVLFCLVLVRAVRILAGTHSRTVHAVAVGLAVVSAAFLLGSAQRLGLQAIEAGLLPEDMRSLLLGAGQVALSVGGLAAAVYALHCLRGPLRQIASHERVVDVLSGRVVPEVPADQWDLSEREEEVMRAIRSGMISDNELADALFISPATAATHVRNILAKAGLHKRIDLLIVDRPDSPRR